MLYTKRYENLEDGLISVRLSREPLTDGQYHPAYQVNIMVPFDIDKEGRACVPRTTIEVLGLWSPIRATTLKEHALELLVVAEEAERLEIEGLQRYNAWQEALEQKRQAKEAERN